MTVLAGEGLGLGAEEAAPVEMPLRDPGAVMRLGRLGSFHQTRISFLRSLLRQMGDERWQIARVHKALDSRGVGEVLYRIDTPHGVYSFAAFCHDIDPAERTDRVIADKWDFTFALLAGVPDRGELDRLAVNVPYQEAGRTSARELVLSRGNKSARLFDVVADTLAAGNQPRLADIQQVGYLMRTTAVYGNGKFGLRDYDALRDTPPFDRPFACQMLCVYMAKLLSLDVVEHVAGQRRPETAVALDPRLKRYFGVGNSTGLGMAPFIVNHPTLLHAWVSARERALARVRGVRVTGGDTAEALDGWLRRAERYAAEWQSADPIQAHGIAGLRRDVPHLRAAVPEARRRRRPWDALVRRAERIAGAEAQEVLIACLLELYPGLVDELAGEMAAPDTPGLDPTMRLDQLQALITTHYGWATAIDFAEPEARYLFWYRSEEKEEPRLGVRAREPGAEKEMRLGIAYEVARLAEAMAQRPGEEPVARLALDRPDLRLAIHRVQLAEHHPYGDIRDNLLSADVRPVDMMRCKLAFFGATKFDPKSDRWTRVTLFQGAPQPADLAPGVDSWVQFPHQPAM